MSKPKECCNSKCENVFHVPEHMFFQKDLCDECAEKTRIQLTNYYGKQKDR